MSYSVETNFVEGMAFDVSTDNHTLRFDTTADLGGKDSGPRPKKLMLGTLAVCSGMDVVSLLKKMRVEHSDFSMDTSADLTDEHPKVFSHIEMIYKIKVAEGDKSKVEKAVKLSQERYCGISEMLRKNSPIDFHIEYL